MRKILSLTVCLLSPQLACAVVCKTVDQQGHVSYSEMATEDCPQPVRLPPSNSYPSRVPSLPVKTSSTQAAPATVANAYRRLEIEIPAPGATVRNNEGTVGVQVVVDPPLVSTDRVRILVDGQTVGTYDGLHITLSAVPRGSHRLQAQLIGADERLLMTSAARQFTMRQHSRLRPQEPPLP